jgi:hypothetical protein
MQQITVGLAVRTANPPLQQDTTPHAVICSLTLLMMDNFCPKHVELILKINKYCYLLRLVGLDFITLPTVELLKDAPCVPTRAC